MKISSLLRFVLPGVGLAATVLPAAEFRPEVGASYFSFHDARYEGSQAPFQTDEPGQWAPYVAVTAGFSPHVGLRLAYHYVRDIEATVGYGSPPGTLLPVVVYGHYRDTVHLLSLSPEFSWQLNPKLSF